MPVGPVDSNGTVLYYEDSGVPPESSSTYATVVLAHGTMFHSAIFRRMMPYAAAHSLRLVLLNLRDYPGSTRYSAAELGMLGGPTREAQDAAITARGREIAAFMHWYIETEHIPPISKGTEADETQRGGISLLGWSSGNCQTLSVLAHADKLPEETRVLLGAYLRSLILHDASLTSIGETAPELEGLYSPFRDPNLNYDEKVLGFSKWVSCYWSQTDLAPQSSAFAATVVERKMLHEADTPEADRRLPSVERMSAEKFAAVTDIDVMARSQILLQRIDTEIYQENLRRALSHLYVVDETGVKQPVWPALKVQVDWCDMSVGEELWAATKIRRQYGGLSDPRRMEVFRVEKANHFVHWDEPERFTEFLARMI
ncbi:hypothetical protein B0H21DRAFT_812571 [Amylocystis lapponica]|nr:hypothetical protein B0H21DRAFT_812571 [Amylocystis lapponica]